MEEKPIDDDHLNQGGPGTIHLSHPVRTPASLQPYLEDDVSETPEDSEAITGWTGLGDKRPELSQFHNEEKANPTKQEPPLEQEPLEVNEAVQKRTDTPVGVGGEAKQSGSSLSKRSEETRQGSAGETQKAGVSRPVSQYDTDQHQHHTDAADAPGPLVEMQERRRSRLSQAFASPEESVCAEPSGPFQRTFTPPAGPLSAMPLNSPPQFMSPMPMRAAYPSHEHFAVHGGSNTYPPGQYGVHPMAIGPDRAPPYATHIPRYMDHMIQGTGPVTFGQPREMNSSFHSDDVQAISASSANPAEASYDPTGGLLARVESALPDIHQLIYRHREVSSQMNIQISTFRNADAQKNELLREKDLLISRLAMELQEHHHQHMHERSQLEIKLNHLKDEQRRLKDKTTRRQASEPPGMGQVGELIAQTAPTLEFQTSGGQSPDLCEKTLPEHKDTYKVSGFLEQPSAKPDSFETSTSHSPQGESRMVPQEARGMAQKSGEDAKAIQAEPIIATEGPVAMLETRTDPAGNAQQPDEASERRPATKRTRTHLIDIGDLEEGEKIEVEMASDQEHDHKDHTANEALVLENLKLRDDLKSVHSNWETDKAELVETNRRLGQAAVKLGIENVSGTHPLHVVRY